MVTINPEIIKWAIDTSPFKKEEIAKKIKKPIKNIDDWLSGKEKMTFAEAKRLSEIVGRNPTIFLLDKPISDTQIPMDFRLQKGVKKLGIKSMKVIRKAKYIQERIYEIMNLLKMNADCPIKSVSLYFSPLEKAKEIRTLLGLEELNNDKIDDNTFFEKIREKLYNLNILVLMESLPYQEIRGFSLLDRKPYMIVVNNSDPFPKSKIFSLFHELGHLLLRKGALCNPEEIPIENNTELEKFKIEKWCNTFAACTLVSPEVIFDTFKGKSSEVIEERVKKISSKYHISKSAIYITLYENNIIDLPTLNDFQSKFVKPIKKGGRAIPLEKRIIKKFGKNMTKLVFYAHDEKIITTHDLMSIISIKLENYERVKDLVEK
ncbi:MAG: ImmA/IrrE family metallo-endopeptidase [Nitrososphaeria archaeon]